MILLNKLFSTKKSAKGRVDYPLLLLGAVIYGVSVGLILSPNEIAPGGASGLAVMLSRFLPLGVGSLTMAINLPYKYWCCTWFSHVRPDCVPHRSETDILL